MIKIEENYTTDLSGGHLIRLINSRKYYFFGILLKEQLYTYNK